MERDDDFGVFRDLQTHLDRVTGPMGRVRRWGRYGTAERPYETVQEHTVQQTMLVIYMLELERAYGDASCIDGEELVVTALVHDQGEPQIGEVQWDAKQHPRLRGVLEEVEQEFYERFCTQGLPPPVRTALEVHFARQHDRESRTGCFFHASEIVGYMIRAVQQYRAGEHDRTSQARRLGVHVFVLQYGSMCACAEEFTSANIIFEAFREEVERALTSDPECIAYAEEMGKTAEIHALLVQHAVATLGALAEGVDGNGADA